MTISRDLYVASDATDLAALVQSGQVSAAELLDCALAEADRSNATINAIVHRFDDAARAAAAAVPKGRLAGVPMLLKDMACAYAGQGTRLASQFLPRIPAEQDSASVARMKRAGLVPFGFTNASELGLISFCETALYGPARNPHDLSRTPGGSSGGAAAAVAAGIVPIAHASDAGGSIRIPASCCGLVGLKPSRGRVSVAPDGEWTAGLGVQGVVTRSVRDSAAMLDILSGYVTGDPYVCRDENADFTAGLTAAPRKLRIAFDVGPLRETAPDPVCASAVRDAARLCESLGHHVTEGRPPVLQDDATGPVFAQAFHVLYSVGLAALVDQLAAWQRKAPRAADFEALTWAYYQEGSAHSGSAYLQAVGKFGWLTRSIARYFEDEVDIWITPTLYRLPPLIGAYDAKAPGASLHDPFFPSLASACALYNATGHPAISLPLHRTPEGLPVGVMFGASYGGEAILLNLAAQLEAAQPWRHHLPARVPA